MTKRESLRIPVRIDVDYSIGTDIYTGTITNLSENGMYLKTNGATFDKDSIFNVTIPSDKENIAVNAEIIRFDIEGSDNKGIGLKILNRPQNYLDFVEHLLYIL